MRVGGYPVVVAQWDITGGSRQRCPGFDSWRLKAEVSWVRLLAAAVLFTFTYFILITSKFIYFQCEALTKHYIKTTVELHKVRQTLMVAQIQECLIEFMTSS